MPGRLATGTVSCGFHPVGPIRPAGPIWDGLPLKPDRAGVIGVLCRSGGPPKPDSAAGSMEFGAFFGLFSLVRKEWQGQSPSLPGGTA